MTTQEKSGVVVGVCIIGAMVLGAIAVAGGADAPIPEPDETAPWWADWMMEMIGTLALLLGGGGILGMRGKRKRRIAKLAEMTKEASKASLLLLSIGLMGCGGYVQIEGPARMTIGSTVYTPAVDVELEEGGRYYRGQDLRPFHQIVSDIVDTPESVSAPLLELESPPD